MKTPIYKLLAGTALALTLGVFTTTGASALDLGVGTKTGVNAAGVGVGVNSDVNAGVNTGGYNDSDAGASARTRTGTRMHSNDNVYAPSARSNTGINAATDADVNARLDNDVRIDNDVRARADTVSNRGEEMRREDNRRRSWWQGDASTRARAGMND